MSQTTNEPPLDWRAFEDYVASLYRSLGYRVSQNQLVAGQQVDLVVERSVPGLGLVKSLVECKYRSSGNLSNQEIQEFLVTFESLRSVGAFTTGVLVTSSNFTSTARAVAEKTGAVQLLTARELEQQLFSLDDAMHSVVVSYEASEIFKRYLALSGSGYFPARERTAVPIPDVESQTLEWIQSDEKGLLSVLADFGAGKTTLMNRIRYRCAKAYLEGRSSKIPALFLLKERRRFGALEEFVLEVLQRDYYRPIPLDIFWTYAAAGNFVLLLDGFDEISAISDKALRRQYFLDMASLITSGSPALLTCRPSYFLNLKEYNSLLREVQELPPQTPRWRPHRKGNAVLNKSARADNLLGHLRGRVVGEKRKLIVPVSTGTVHLDQLSQGQIDDYLEKFDDEFRSAIGQSWQNVKAFLGKVYDVTDLMARPILLDMIVETVLSGRIDITDEELTIGPASLYEIYTTMQFEVEWHKGESRRLMTPDERRLFVEALASRMAHLGVLQVGYEDILSVIRSTSSRDRDLSGKLKELTEEQVATDIQVCSFLSRGKDNLFRFTHKSFAEFFLARSFVRTMESSPERGFLTRRLPEEVLYFLGSFASLSSRVMDALRSLLFDKGIEEEDDMNLRRNVAAALLFAGPDLVGVELRAAKISGFSFPHVNLRRSVAERLVLEDVRIKTLEVEGSTWEQDVLRRCDLGILAFRGRSDVEMRIEDSYAESLILDSTSMELAGRRFEVRTGRISDSKILLRTGISIGEGVIEDSEVRVVPKAAELSLGATRLSKVTLGIAPFPGNEGTSIVRFSRAHLEDCSVFWLSCGEDQFLEMTAEGRLSSCKGALLLRLYGGSEGEEEDTVTAERMVAYPADVSRERLKKAGFFWYGNLCLVNAVDFLDEKEKSLRSRIRESLQQRFGHPYGAFV